MVRPQCDLRYDLYKRRSKTILAARGHLAAVKLVASVEAVLQKYGRHGRAAQCECAGLKGLRRLVDDQVFFEVEVAETDADINGVIAAVEQVMDDTRLGAPESGRRAVGHAT